MGKEWIRHERDCICLDRNCFKSSVQQKLRWVKNSANRWVLAWGCGTRQSFISIINLCLVSNIFPFPVSKAKLIGDVWNNRWSHWSVPNSFRALPILFCPLRCANTIGTAILTTLVGEAANIKNPQIFGIGTANAPCFAYRRNKYTLLSQ
jgi:hypothetical protein